MAGRTKNNALVLSLDDTASTGGPKPAPARTPILDRLNEAKRHAGKTWGLLAQYDPDRDRTLLAAEGPGSTHALRLFMSIGNGRGSTKIHFSPEELGVIASTLEECKRWIEPREGEHPLASVVRRTFTATAAGDGKIDCSFKTSEKEMSRSIDLTSDEIEDTVRWLRGFETALRMKLAKLRAESKVVVPSPEPEEEPVDEVSEGSDVNPEPEGSGVNAADVNPAAGDPVNEGSDEGSDDSALDLSDDDEIDPDTL